MTRDFFGLDVARFRSDGWAAIDFFYPFPQA
jgi:hypothetical protein